MEEKIQELIEKIYNYDILRVKVLFKDFGKYIIEGTFLLREEVSFNFLYSYDSSMSIEWNIKHIENIIDVIDGIELDVHEDELKVTNDYIKSLNLEV